MTAASATSPMGIEFLERHEGVVLKAYRCPAGVWTIGAGLTSASGVVKVTPGMRITHDAARGLLAKALARNYEPRVRRAVPGANQHEFDAAVSFDFNTGAIHRASWVKAFARRDWNAVRSGLAAWRKGGGKVLPGLVRRREEEYQLMRYARYGGVLAMLAALAVSLPMYVCATASVPIATALVAGGLPTGAALVFLMAGPATNVATIGAVGKTLGRRALTVYLTVIIAGSIAFGLTFEWLLAGAGTHAGHHHHGDSWWATVAAVALAALFGRFAWKDARRLAAARGLSRPLDAGAPTMQIDVAGMHCNSCVDRVASALAAEPGVEHVRVTLQPQQATVQGTISRERAAEIIAATGFETR